MSSKPARAPQQVPASKKKHNVKFFDDLKFHNGHIKETTTVKRSLELLIIDPGLTNCVSVQFQGKKKNNVEMDPWAASITSLFGVYQRPTRGCGQLASVCSELLGTQEEVLPPFLTTVTLIPARGRAIASSCPIPTIAEANFLPRGKRQMLSSFL